MPGANKKSDKKMWARLVITITALLILAVAFYRVDPSPDSIPVSISNDEIPEITSQSTISFTEAPENIGNETWVKGEVNHVFVSNNHHFINFCSNFRECPFSSVVFSEDAQKFDDIESWSGEIIHIYGAISTYENRPQIIIKNPDQVQVNTFATVTKKEIKDEEKVSAEVINVIDGDTIQARINSSVETVRLIGINTPEVDTEHTEEECFGPEASQRAKELLEEEMIELMEDSRVENHDKHNRLLRYVFTEDGEHINALLIEEGYAFYFPVEQFKFMNQFAELEKHAKTNQLGIWSNTCDYLL